MALTGWRDMFGQFFRFAEDLPYFPADAYEDRRSAFIARGAGLVVLAVAAHWPGLSGGWLWVDGPLLRDNIFVRSIGMVCRAWVHPVRSPVSPLPTLLYHLQILAFGAGPGGYHVISLALHGANALLVWVVLRRLDVRSAWLAAAIFAVHPMEAAGVTWIGAQPVLWGAFFGLVATWQQLRLSQIYPAPPADFVIEPPNRLRAATWASVFLVLAMLSDPVAVMLPATFFLILWWKRGRVSRREAVEAASVIALAAAVGIARVVTAEVSQAGGLAASLTLLQRIEASGAAVCFYFAKLTTAFPVLFVEPRWGQRDSRWMAVACAALLAVLWTSWLARKRLGRGVFTAVALLVVLPIPVTPLVRQEWTRLSFVGDHLQYLPGIAIIALLASALNWLIEAVARGGTRNVFRAVVGFVILGTLFAITWTDSVRYGNEIALLRHAVAYDRGALASRGELGLALLRQGDGSQAAMLFDRPTVGRLNAMVSRGGADAGAAEAPLMAYASVLENERRYSEAVEVYRGVIAIDPGNQEVRLRLGQAYAARGDKGRELEQYFDALRRSPDNEKVLNDLGLALMTDGRVEEAVEYYEKAVRIDPNFVAARLNLANAYFVQQKLDESSAQLQTVVKIDPRNFEAYMNAGVMLAQLKDFAKSERMLKAAVILRGDSAEAHNNLGIALAAQQFYTEAVDHFEKAVKLRPDFQAAAQNLAKARAARDAQLNLK